MKALILLLVFVSLGCTHLTVTRGENAKRSGTQTELTLRSFAWGFVPRRLPPEPEVCPKSRIESVDLYQDSGDVWLAIVTLGVYVPYQADIYCGTGLNGTH